MSTAVAVARPALQRARAYVDRLLRATPDYQPDPFDRSPQSQRTLRSCADRFDAIAARLPSDRAPSVLDVGCHLGYFAFRMAARGGVCIGLDRSAAAIKVARARAQRHLIRNAAFLELDLNPGVDVGLPSADVVLCLSVFHHWVRQFGHAGALTLLERVAKSARQVLVFETGQPGELEMKWAGQLNFMLPDPTGWTHTTLANLGFTVEHAGEFPSGVSQGNRPLFIAQRISQQ